MRALVELVWPSVCAACGTEGQGRLCGACAPAQVLRMPAPHPAIRGVFVAATYDDPVGNAIRRAKVDRDRGLASLLGSHLAEVLAPRLRGAAFTAVIPVPSPLSRRLRRGFDGPAVLADSLARQLAVPVRHALRQRSGPRQATLDAAARRRNLAGRFRPRLALHGPVLLVDDVVTTGTTIAGCALALNEAGATEVWVAALCGVRAPSPDRSRF